MVHREVSDMGVGVVESRSVADRQSSRCLRRSRPASTSIFHHRSRRADLYEAPIKPHAASRGTWMHTSITRKRAVGVKQ